MEHKDEGIDTKTVAICEEREWFMSAVSKPASQRAMRAYGDQIARDGVPAWSDETMISPWSDGTAVDLLGDDE